MSGACNSTCCLGGLLQEQGSGFAVTCIVHTSTHWGNIHKQSIHCLICGFRLQAMPLLLPQDSSISSPPTPSQVGRQEGQQTPRCPQAPFLLTTPAMLLSMYSTRTVSHGWLLHLGFTPRQYPCPRRLPPYNSTSRQSSSMLLQCHWLVHPCRSATPA